VQFGVAEESIVGILLWFWIEDMFEVYVSNFDMILIFALLHFFDLFGDDVSVIVKRHVKLN